MSITKSGIITSSNIYESVAMNYVQESDIGKSFQYTPSTGNNSCIEGYYIDYTNCKPGEKIYVRVKIEWNGFDRSNTNGTFSMWFQGATYNVTTNKWEWAGINNATTSFGSNFGTYGDDITNLVLSSTSGIKVLNGEINIDPAYPTTRTKERFGIRSNYSNGTGWVKISELEVIPERFYIPRNNSGGGFSSLHIGKDYISSGELYEI